jgi:DNA-binding PadR family transcriptional regulator
MSLDHAILGFLATEDLSGYDLKTRCFTRQASHFWTADQAQVYRTLDRLQSKRLVTSKTIRQHGKPDRHVYSLTRAGREVLADWVASSHPLPPLRDPFLLQLYFGPEVPDETLIEVLSARRDELQVRLDGLRSRAAALARTAGKRPDRAALIHRLTIDGALAETRATIDWLDDCIETVRSSAERAGSQRTLFGTTGPRGGAT